MNKPVGPLLCLILLFIVSGVLIAARQPSPKTEMRTFPVSQRIREAFCGANSGHVRLEDSDVEDLAWALVRVRKMGQTPEGQREADAQAVEALTSEVSDPMWRAAITRAAAVIRGTKQEHPRQQR